jgi:hypothetical protein
MVRGLDPRQHRKGVRDLGRVIEATDAQRKAWHEILRENLSVGVERDGHHFVWLEVLGLYGPGETFEEARRHLLRQVGEAIDERLEIGDASTAEGLSN